MTILLVFMALTGKAQVKTALDLCLRDESTGEWLIGFFNEYAVYDCEYWENVKADTVQDDFMKSINPTIWRLYLR